MNLLTHVELYAEYYTNQEYGLLFWHRDEMTDFTYRISLSAVETKWSFAYSNRLEPRMAYSNWRARMRGGLPNHICRSCDQRLAT